MKKKSSSLAPSKRSAKAKPGEKRSQRERAVAVCALLAVGNHSVRQALEAEGLHNGEFYKLLKADAELRALYEGALEQRHHARFDALEKEAGELQGEVLKAGPAASAMVSAFAQRVNLAKFRAEREAPKKYGQRMAIGGDPDGAPVKFERIVREIVEPGK